MKVATSVASVIAAMLAAPAIASAGPVGDLINQVGNTVNHTVNGLLGNGDGGSQGPAPTPQPAPAQGSTPAPSQASPTPQQFVPPPIDGTNPHGQGTALDATLPLEGELAPVIVGKSRGEQGNDGQYRGKVTILSVLGLEVSVETEEGESESSPLDPLNQQVLDEICNALAICLTLLDFGSETNGNGSFNHFSVASADLLDGLVTTGVLQSNGNISDDGQCQTAYGDSNVASANVGDLITADALQSDSESQACRDGTQSTNANSTVLNLLGVEILEFLGCGPGLNSEFEIPALLTGVCHADDTNGGQTNSPYNVRWALALAVVPVLAELDEAISELPIIGDIVNLENGLLVLRAGMSESHAVAPAAPPTPPGPPGPPAPPGPPPDEVDEPPVELERPAVPDRDRPTARPTDELPFSGADMLLLALIGFGVMAGGLGGMALADRRRGSTEE